jgi:hypothetical protein
VSKWGWQQGKFGFRKRKDQKWELKGKIWQPVLKEEHVVREITTRMWLAAKVKLYRVRERIPGMGAPSTPGIPDLIGYLQISCPLPVTGGRAQAIPLYIEVKRPGGVRRIAQIQFIDEARAAGCVAFFAESWEQVREEMAIVGFLIPA